MKAEQQLADTKKKLTEAESSVRALRARQKELLDAQKRARPASSAGKTTPAKAAPQSCAECKAKDKARQEMQEQLSKAEKEILEAKNEKMQAILEQRDVEDRLRDLERDSKDRELQLKTTAANELKDLTANHSKEIKKLKTQLRFAELELMEERHGNEEHVKMTEMVLGQLN